MRYGNISTYTTSPPPLTSLEPDTPPVKPTHQYLHTTTDLMTGVHGPTWNVSVPYIATVQERVPLNLVD